MKIEALKLFVVLPLISVSAIGHMVTPMYRDLNLNRCFDAVIKTQAMTCARQQAMMSKLFANLNGFNLDASYADEEDIFPKYSNDFRQLFKRSDGYIHNIKACCFRPCSMDDILRTC